MTNTDASGSPGGPRIPLSEYPELRDLRYFTAAAEELHFTRAAQRLHISQQVLSSAIRQLETRVGISLFERTTRTVRLTPAGEAMLLKARQAISAAAEAVAVARDVGHGVVGRIGISRSAHRLGAPILRALRQRLEPADVDVRVDYVQPLIDALLAGDLDAAVLHCPEHRTELAYQRLSDQPIVAVMLPDHRLAGRNVLHLSELSEEIVVLAPPAISRGYNRAILSLLQRHDVTVHTAESTAYLEPVGVPPNEVLGIITEIAVDSVPTAVELVHVPIEGHSLPFELVWHGANDSPLVDTLRSVATVVARTGGWPLAED